MFYYIIRRLYNKKMWQEIVKSKLTKSAKATLTNLINDDIKYYKETITHDGNDGEYFQSDIYDLHIITFSENKYKHHHYHMEDWKNKTHIHYYLLDKPQILDKQNIDYFKNC
jgi:hypothetical protein